MIVEPDGYLGVTDEIVGPLSLRATVVSHFRNINAVDRFKWYEDGELRLRFEPPFPYRRDGIDPDSLVAEMWAAGFDLSEGEGRDFDLVSEAAFALAERITGGAAHPRTARHSGVHGRGGVAPLLKPNTA